MNWNLKVPVAALIIIFTGFSRADEIKSQPYIWKNVQMVGGGFVDGIIFHPTAKGLCYARTDMGGAYRRDSSDGLWQPLLDWIGYDDYNLMGVESIAVDPADPDRVYMACGTYTRIAAPNAILRSSDRGRTFHRTNVPFRMGGNEDGRGNGERMAVDPHNGKIIYFGSRIDGPWKSTDRGVTWQKVDGFPDITEIPPSNSNDDNRQSFRRRFRRPRSSGIIAVVFDPRSKTDTGCSTIYAAASLMGRDNLFRSTDHGQNWHPVPNQPTQYRPTHAILSGDGNLYITYGSSPGPSRMTNGGVWKLNTKTNEWTDITPEKPTDENRFGYAAISVDTSNPKMLIVSTFNHGPREQLFRSTDAGKTWKPVFTRDTTFDDSKAPYVERTPIHWMFDIEIDPTNPDHAIITTGYGGYETFNLTAIDADKPTHWSVMSTGIEETVALELLSPPKGAHLITAIGDYGGFVHWALDKPAPEGNFINPRFGNTDGVACAWQKPEIIVRVGVSADRGTGNIGYSLDSGKTWQTASQPNENSARGHIAVSADGSTWIWTPQRSAAYVTDDQGKTWTECEELPRDTRVIADRVNPKVFYAMDLFGGKLFVSTDSGKTFESRPLNLPGGLPERPSRFGSSRGDPRGGQDRLYAAPGKEGDLWLAAFDGLYHSTDTGKTLIKIEPVKEMHGFGFGKAAPKSDYPALYMIGVVDDTRGIFRSDDIGKSWVRINDDDHEWGLVLHITGDPKMYGRVYVGTHGRGTLYGDPKIQDQR